MRETACRDLFYVDELSRVRRWAAIASNAVKSSINLASWLQLAARSVSESSLRLVRAITDCSSHRPVETTQPSADDCALRVESWLLRACFLSISLSSLSGLYRRSQQVLYMLHNARCRCYHL